MKSTTERLPDESASLDEFARKMAADLIVIGTHGHGELEKILFGSTAEKTVRRAPYPVLVARRKEDFSTTNPKGCE